MKDYGSKSSGASLHDGLTTKSPPCSDASMKPPSGSVNDNPVRTEVAKSKTLGPRTA